MKRILASNMNGVEWIGYGAVNIPDDLDWQDVDIKVPARLAINNKVEDKQLVHQIQLTFLTCSWNQDARHWCYLVGLADGTFSLIGTGSRPYPVTTSSQSLSDNVADSQLVEVSVSLSSRDVLPLIVSI